MGTMDVYGFAHKDLLAARRTIEDALLICLEEAEESSDSGECYFRSEFPDGTCVQIRRNSGPHQRWQGDSSNPWFSGYGVLVFVHGPAQESVAGCLRGGVSGLSFLEKKETM